jgi:hypothetical protein
MHIFHCWHKKKTKEENRIYISHKPFKCQNLKDNTVYFDSLGQPFRLYKKIFYCCVCNKIKLVKEEDYIF